MTEKERLDRITRNIIGAAMEVHRELGPGLLESAYEACLAFVLAEQGLRSCDRSLCQWSSETSGWTVGTVLISWSKMQLS